MARSCADELDPNAAAVGLDFVYCVYIRLRSI